MANTTFEEIYKLALMSIQDYRIKNLFADTPEVADELLESFLINAVAKFITCVKPIKILDFENQSFNCELDIVEKVIIKDLIVLSWLDWTINDITQMNWALNDND